MNNPDQSPAWTAQLRDVADFPRPGIVFKDINPLLAHPQARAQALQTLIMPKLIERSDDRLAAKTD